MATKADGTAVIIGAGQAGITLAISLREKGWVGDIHLIGTEQGLPYQRPRLSKGYVLGTENETDLQLSSEAALRRDRIDFRPGRTAVTLDTMRRVVRLDDGAALRYTAAVLATGASPRELPLPGARLPGIHTLRTVADADALRTALRAARDVVIVGGGFLGLEIATIARTAARVTVLEGAGRILLRAISAPTAERLRERHESQGVRTLTGVGIAGFEGSDRVERVVLADGMAIAADTVVVAVGAAANTELAERAGLAVDRGIVVDESLRTSGPRVFAIGDCAVFPSPLLGAPVRLESVQNATDQARFVAALLTGAGEGAYRALPWFWSHQAGGTLQIAGLAVPEDDAVVVEETADSLVVHRERHGRLVAVETIDNPRAHVRARRLLNQTEVATVLSAETR